MKLLVGGLLNVAGTQLDHNAVAYIKLKLNIVMLKELSACRIVSGYLRG